MKLAHYEEHLKKTNDLRIYFDPGYLKIYGQHFLAPCLRYTRIKQLFEITEERRPQAAYFMEKHQRIILPQDNEQVLEFFGLYGRRIVPDEPNNEDAAQRRIDRLLQHPDERIRRDLPVTSMDELNNILRLLG